MDFKFVDKKYRPIPFWSWNEKLDTDETARQIRMMDKAGIGGFFMHARGGLQTEYMGEEWFDNVRASIDTAKETGMHPWAYDENGWPSGFGNGVVNAMGVKYQQKSLLYEDTPTHKDTQICEAGGRYFYYNPNPFYVDVLDKEVIAEFIKVAYQPYYERYGNEIEGFFTDEPQISRFNQGIPWSFVFVDEYKKRYNDDLCSHLNELFFCEGDWETTRIRFWKMVTELFSEAYMKQIFDWCNDHNVKLTGHLLLEETLTSQLISSGACMPHYEYMHVPGMDWLGRNIKECLTPKQVSTVAEQFGMDSVLSETFALCGHNVSFAELKGIYEWQMVHGITLLCQHLEGYSNRGIRKRDFPPAMYYQQPWWEDYDKFNNAMSRIGMILSTGKKQVDVLVLHPQTTAWKLFDLGDGMKKVNELTDEFLSVIKTIEQKHIQYHFGDEILMERHGRVENGKLVIGNCAYSCVVDDCCQVLFDNTKALLEQFKAQGGKVISADELCADNVVESEKITYTVRLFDDFKVHYFVNTSPDRFTAKVNVCGKMMDIYTGDLSAFGGLHEFEPWGSLVIIEDGCSELAEKPAGTPVYLNGEYNIMGKVENSITLDKCDYYFDGELQEKNGYVLNVCERANALGRRVKIHQDYFVDVNYIPQELFLVCETPWIFDISVNGKAVEYIDCGYFRDSSFRKIEISKLLTLGKNTISFDIDFKQSDAFYENLEKSYRFESERNKLSYDLEIEAIYLVGDFSVATPGKWTKLEAVDKAAYNNKHAYRYSGDFVIEKPVKKIGIKNIQMNGFPFFSGKLNLQGEIEVSGENPVLELEMKGINCVHLKIDGREFVTLTDNKIALDGVSKGICKVEISVINNLRNLLGPHHHKDGEHLSVGPGSFFKEYTVWNKHFVTPWDDGYCFVETTL